VEQPCYRRSIGLPIWSNERRLADPECESVAKVYCSLESSEFEPVLQAIYELSEGSVYPSFVGRVVNAFNTLSNRTYRTRFVVVANGKADYGALNELAPQRINTALIVQHWEDLLRLAGSLKLGTMQAAGLIRTLQTKDRPTKLARALEELGRLIKTLYLLRFIDDEAYRRRILVQLNRGEGRHQLARIVFYGKRGELRQRYREGQEDQLGALGLVVNVIVLWNTVYMDAALNQLRAESFDVRDEDVARLSPLSFDHVNMLRRYAFILPDQIARGELRPLRDPQNPDDDG